MRTTTRLVEIDDVRLKTLSVEVKALTVSGRQMTLSVFRQLPHENIFDDGYHLKGIPWGTVNYFWPGNEGDLHVVWQRDDQLFRSVHRKPNIDKFREINGVFYYRGEFEQAQLKLKYFAGVERIRVEFEKSEQKLAAVESDAREKYQTALAAYRDLSMIPQLYIAM